MNLPLRRVVLSFCSAKSRFVPVTGLEAWKIGARNAPALVIPQREVHNYERPYRLVVRARKQKEKFKYPERFTKIRPRNTYSDWNYKAELFAFGKRLGEDFDDAVLREALTDQSYIHQERKKQEELGIDTSELQLRNNEELTDLGRQFSRSVLLEFLRREIPGFPTEGHHALLSYLTSLETMADVGLHLGLKDLILCEEYPPANETLSRAMFAVIGALEKSSGSERTQKFVIDFIASLLCGKDINEIWDIERPWLLMEEIAKQKGLHPIEPRLIAEAGRNTIHGAFLVGMYDKNKRLLGKGAGESIDIAQEMAARDTLKTFFNTRDPRTPFEFQSANLPYKLVPHVRNIHK